MAHGILAAPGTEYGPCEDTDCGHTDCAASRDQAREACYHCGRIIGYGVRYYTDETGSIHARCAEAVLMVYGQARRRVV